MLEEKNMSSLEDNGLDEASLINYEAMSLTELTNELKRIVQNDKIQGSGEAFGRGSNGGA